MQKFTFTNELRNQLKSPLGLLVKDIEVKRGMLEKYFSKPILTVCVGDRTTERLNEFGFSVNLEIVDMMERRFSRPSPKLSSERDIIRANNDAGSITSDAIQKLDRILDVILRDAKKTVRLVVNGEEDLLTLPVVAFFPDDTVVFYGQPAEGLVIVESRDAKQKAKEILATVGIKSLKIS
ncbi:MAG: GTP-dependent dephospho-CoA kinase family protein [Nitrososphaerales archaeon]